MRNIEFTAHARAILTDRNILEEWIWQTLEAPDSKTILADKNTHYLRAISENENRVLRIVVNENVEPHRIVTAFFDRRMGRQK